MPPSEARLATAGLTPCSNGKGDALRRKGGRTATERRHHCDGKGAGRGLTRCATERSSAGNSGSDPLKRRKGGSTATERGRHCDGKRASGHCCAGQVFRAAERDIGSDPLLPVLAQQGQTPCRTGKPNGQQGGEAGRQWGHRGREGVRPDVPPSEARLATAGLTPCSDGKEDAQRWKGGFRSLLCRAGDSCSGARHWVRPSVASSGTGGSDPLSHRQTERTSGWRSGAGRGRKEVTHSH